jgi:hypothetical protein
MTTVREKLFYVGAGVLLTLFVVSPVLKETMRQTRWGLLLSPEDVKVACGRPQQDDVFKIMYGDQYRHLELQFIGVNHRMYLSKVSWGSINSTGAVNQVAAGKIDKVSRQTIIDYVKAGTLPVCLERAIQ